MIDVETGDLKLIDFGLAQKFIKNKELNVGGMVGTPQYLSPEAFEGISSKEVDLWSLGVMLHILISGSYPWAGKTPEELIGNIKQKPSLNFELNQWKKVSKEGKDLVKQLLRIEPSKRIKAKEALEHPWFTKYCPVMILATSVAEL